MSTSQSLHSYHSPYLLREREREMADKPHAVRAPFPDQGHINPKINLAKIK